VNEFLRNEEFDERFVGLTGSVEQCAAAARAFHVYRTVLTCVRMS
jgi:cytochrome oxidase Cu insertion factor (SCO1/SenC/PrrC family)